MTTSTARLIDLHEGRVYPIGGAPLALGRHPRSDVLLSGNDASRRHAYLLKTPQGVMLVDTSTHGTYVNGDRVQSQQLLAAGDVIHVGGSTFRFDGDEPAGAATGTGTDPEVLPVTSDRASIGVAMPIPAGKLAIARALAARPSARARAAEWIRRYSLGEIVGLAAALAGSWLVYGITHNAVAAAFGASIGEAIGFYGMIVVREMVDDAYAAGAHRAPYGFREIGATWRGLLLEFGPAELFDTGIVRPAAMWLGEDALGRPLGIMAGKLLADLAFYAPVIVSYELRKAREGRRGRPPRLL
jgi:hypothetical protein